jgi:KDO2-lipid IV(A) lauroyltransferase
MEALYAQPSGLGRQSSRCRVRLLVLGTAKAFVAFLTLLGWRSQRGPSHYSDTLLRVRNFPMPKSSEPTLRHRLEYAAFRSAESLIRLLPWQMALAVGAGVGRFYHLLDARHRRVVRENLRGSDLGLSELEIRRVARACFAHFGSLLFATVRMLHMSEARVRSLVRFEGLEHFDAAAAEGKGFIALTGHFGNWELMALALSLEGRTLAVIGRELDNPFLEPYLSGLRGRFGNTVIPKDGAMRGTLKVLRMGKAVGFLLDQDALGNGVFTQFHGRWASTHPTAGLLAVKYGLPIVPIFNRVHADGTLTVVIHPPLRVAATEDPERDTWIATQLMTRCIEAVGRRDPARWFWMHRRFKTQPATEGQLPPGEWQAEAAARWDAYSHERTFA